MIIVQPWGKFVNETGKSKMIKSMTGFGRSEYCDGKRRIITEIRSVNHRYADVSVRMPRRYSFAEERVKAAVKSTVKRGKVDVSIMVEYLTEDDVNIKLNHVAAGKYYDSLTELREGFSLPGEISIQLLASFPDVLKTVPDIENEEELSRSLESSAEQAALNLDAMRAVEGEKLAEDILMRGALIRKLTSEIKRLAPETVKLYYEKFKERIKELTSGAVILPEERVAAEAAIIADKSNITEELVRLDSHVFQMEDVIKNSGRPEGKKLDFLAQEMNREANTMGSKSISIDITKIILDIRCEIEKIREQVQNIE